MAYANAYCFQQYATIYCSRYHHVEGWHRGKRASGKVFGVWFAFSADIPSLLKRSGSRSERTRILYIRCKALGLSAADGNLCFKVVSFLAYIRASFSIPLSSRIACALVFFMCLYYNPHHFCNSQPSSSRACRGCCFRFSDIRYQADTLCPRLGQ